MRFAACQLLVVVLAMFNRSLALAEWCEGFEDYPAGSIDGKGNTWDVKPVTGFGGDNHGAYGEVVTSPVHTGDHALRYRSVWAVFDQQGSWMRWINETGSEYDGLVDLSWWIRPTGDRDWFIDVEGWYWDAGIHTQTVCSLTTKYGTSPSSIDVRDATHGWVESLAEIPDGTWSRVSLQVDFSTSPDQYRIRMRDPFGWSEWFSSGTDTEYLRGLRFHAPHEDGQTSFYFDDLLIVPEPPALFLLASMVAVAVAAYTWRRWKQGAYSFDGRSQKEGR